MEKVSPRKQAVLDVLDDEIAALEAKLAKAQPLIDELNQLRKTRATLLAERSVTGGVRAGTQVTMEQVVHALRENDNESMTPGEIAAEIGADATVVRSHLNRHKDVRYRRNGDGWELIGEEDED
jgi:hypothetical protein